MALGPVSRLELVDRLKKLGYEGPYHGGKHDFLVRGQARLTIPNVHGNDIGGTVAPTGSASRWCFP